MSSIRAQKLSLFFLVIMFVFYSCTGEKALEEEFIGEWVYEREVFVTGLYHKTRIIMVFLPSK